MYAKAAVAVRACGERAAEHSDAFAHADEAMAAARPAVRPGSGVVLDLDLEGPAARSAR